MQLDKRILATLIFVSMFTVGCASSWSVKGKYEDGPFIIEGGISGSSRALNDFLAPLTSALASVGLISESDWSTFDPSTFFIRVEGQGSQTIASTAKVTLLDGNYILAQKFFNVTKTADDFYIANPTVFKSWAASYKDSADKITVELNRETTYFGQGTSTASFYDGSTLLTSAVESHICIDESGENQFICTKE